ncbi:hypothetical protein CWI36_2406p0010, partial [Hamiltosporidium magnivora]
MEIFYLYLYIVVAVCGIKTNEHKNGNSTENVEILCGFGTDGYIVSQEERDRQINHPRFNDMCIITFLSEANPVVLVDQYKKYRLVEAEKSQTDLNESSDNYTEINQSSKNHTAKINSSKNNSDKIQSSRNSNKI